MKIIALRSISKINSDVVQNFRRLFSFKFEMTPANRLAADQTEETKPPPPEESKKIPTNFRYNVCQPRTSPVERAAMAGDITSVQRQTAKATIEEQQLQPSMLPEYFQKQMEKNVLINPEPEPSEEERINSSNQRKFQVSKTYANAILPLKSVKLANPFPEPVKMMTSRTVSDDEKAEQMLAESRNQRSQEWGSKSSTFRSFSTEVKRWYSKSVSTDPKKCKKPSSSQKGKKGGCPRLKMKHCPAVTRTGCDRHPQHKDCKKQEAPYPAYSEFCHEDLDEKPSSCRICPWKPEDNPNFKPQKKKLHSSASMSVRRSGLEMESMEDAAVEEAPPVIEEDETPEGMQCDLRKPECERPKNRRCPPTKEEKKKGEKKKKKEKSKKDASELETDEITTQNLLILRGDKDKGQGSCKIRKFPFPPCHEKKKKEGEIVETGKCRRKKKRLTIRDCPPAGDGKACTTVEEVIEEYSMKNDKSDGTKCPHIDMTTFKDEDAENEDPCKTKRKGTTKICPADLLKKKKRKPTKKKASGVLTPVESKTEQPRPSRTI